MIASGQRKVALVAHWDWPLYNWYLVLGKALREHGCDVIFVCPPGRFTPVIQSEGFRCLAWNIDRLSLHPVEGLRAIRELTAIYRRENPDTVHHCFIKPCVYGAVAASRARVRTTISSLPGRGYIFSDWRQARLLAWALRPLISAALRRADQTILINADDRRMFVERCGLVPSRTTVIPEFVDTRRFVPARAGSDGAAPVVVMGARLLWDKGVAEFVEAAERVKQRHRAEFWIAGDADAGNPACIPETVLATWRQQGAVTFLGHSSDMPGVLQRATLAVLPTHHEGMGRFLLEAAATGLPLITTDLPGPRVIVRDGVNGLIVPVRNAAALASAIERLLEDSELRQKMGRASRHIVESEFDESIVLEQYLGIYRQLGTI